MPIIAMGLGHLLYPGVFYTITGLILATVIASEVSSFVRVSIYRGNIAITLSIIIYIYIELMIVSKMQ
ncbi:hypothetical protein D3C73_1074040 [compost metagenome]